MDRSACDVVLLATEEDEDELAGAEVGATVEVVDETVDELELGTTLVVLIELGAEELGTALEAEELGGTTVDDVVDDDEIGAAEDTTDGAIEVVGTAEEVGAAEEIIEEMIAEAEGTVDDEEDIVDQRKLHFVWIPTGRGRDAKSGV